MHSLDGSRTERQDRRAQQRRSEVERSFPCRLRPAPIHPRRSLRSFVPRLVLLTASSAAWIAACSKDGEHHGAAEPPATGARTTNSVSAEKPPDGDTVPRDPREPDWERDSVVLHIELDTSLAARAQDALLLPPESAGGLSFTQDPEHRFGSFTRSSERELRVQLGRSDGFTGSEVELRLASTPKGELTCRALASDFWDARRFPVRGRA